MRGPADNLQYNVRIFGSTLHAAHTRGIITMPVVEIGLLREIPLFSLMDDQELALLAQNLDERNYLAGQMIISAGEPGSTMFVVGSGRVELFVKATGGEKIVLSVVTAGGLFGELALLDDEPRSASAIALENTRLFVIDRHDLQLLVGAHPAAALDMMAMLGRRIREANILMSERVTRNVNEEIQETLTLGQRLSDFLTILAGDIRFVYFSVIWFGVWIVLNTRVIPGLEPFDPFPFGLLTMVVSLEAIFLSLFVLISQNRQAQRDKVRNDIEYDVNLKAELEIRALTTQVDDLQQLILSHLASLNGNGNGRESKG
jgi:CRP/FNR family cyclic AMP-dependent transcriptional regulator